MWPRYGEPDFALPPKHAEIFGVALGYLSDLIDSEDWESDGFPTGVAVFDQLTQGQRQVALLEVARALLQTDGPTPKVAAYLAAAVAAVYETLLGLIELDIDTDKRQTKVRGQVLDALDEMNYWAGANDALLPDEEPAKRPSKRCADPEVWAEFVEALRTEVLEDYDFEMESSFVDLDPQASSALKRSMNIDPDYFTDVPEDPQRDRLEAIRRELREVTDPLGQ